MSIVILRVIIFRKTKIKAEGSFWDGAAILKVPAASVGAIWPPRFVASTYPPKVGVGKAQLSLLISTVLSDTI